MAAINYKASFLVPDFVEIQRRSFSRFLEKGIIEEFSKINPIRSDISKFELTLYPESYLIIAPEYTVTEAVLHGKTYSCKLYLPAKLSSEHRSKRTNRNKANAKQQVLGPQQATGGRPLADESKSSPPVRRSAEPLGGLGGLWTSPQHDANKADIPRTVSLKESHQLAKPEGSYVPVSPRVTESVSAIPSLSKPELPEACLPLPMADASNPLWQATRAGSPMGPSDTLNSCEGRPGAVTPWMGRVPQRPARRPSWVKGLTPFEPEALLPVPSGSARVDAARPYKAWPTAGLGRETGGGLVGHPSDGMPNTGEAWTSKASQGQGPTPKGVPSDGSALGKRSETPLSWVLVGNLPLMTKRGHFIVNGSPRVVINQLVRSPGVYFHERTWGFGKRKKRTVYADFVSRRGAWLRIQTDKEGNTWARLKKTPKVPFALFHEGMSICERKPNEWTIADREALLELHEEVNPTKKDLSPENGHQFLVQKFKNPRTYDLGRVGRKRLNRRFGLSVLSHQLTSHDLYAAFEQIQELQNDQILVDDIDHLKNRRVRASGELVQGQFETGLYRLEKAILSKMRKPPKELSPRTLLNTKPLNGALREFFGSSPLSQYMDQTNPLAEITQKRRISSLGPGGISRETAGMAVRGIHPTHYGRICPIETPEGKNAGLVNSLTTYTRVGDDGILETPYYRVVQGQVQTQMGFQYFSAGGEEHGEFRVAPGDVQLSTCQLLPATSFPVREAGNREEDFRHADREDVNYMAISPIQMISVATSLIPFLEHDDANRALMGSNMQRQAVPLLQPERPLVGTGLEAVVVAESGHALQAELSGYVSSVSGGRVSVYSCLPSTRSKPPLTNTRLRWPSLTGAGLTGLTGLPGAGLTGLRGVRRSVGRVQRFVERGHAQGRSDGRVQPNDLALQASQASQGQGPTPKGVPLDGFRVSLNKTGPLPPHWPGSDAQGHQARVAFQPLKGKSLSLKGVVDPSAGPTRQCPPNSQADLPSAAFSRDYHLQRYHRSNQETCLTQTSAVSEGDWVQSGDLLADCSASRFGELALGKNILIAYLPWEGYNFEDAVVISERLISDDVYTSIHVQKYDIETRETRFGVEKITRQIPGITDREKEHLDWRGIAKIGSWVKEGDILVGKVSPKSSQPLSPYERLAYDIANVEAATTEDTSLRVPKSVEGRVINCQFLEGPGVTIEKQGPSTGRVRIYLAEKRKLQVGDKVAGRHGNKGIVSTVLPRQDMPYLPDGTIVDMVLNPLGIPSRMNVGQVFECLLGLAGVQLGQQFKITPFDEIYGAEASRSLVYLKLYQARLRTNQDWLFNSRFPGKTPLLDGRTGRLFDQWITVGYAYMLKLVHLVDEKIHARSTGPYSLVTKQPLGGRSKHGGQRLGEMEVWALEGFGAAYTLQEMLTSKSDDVVGREQVVEAILFKGRMSLGNPEAFKVLVRELQSLCLDVGVYVISPGRLQREAVDIGRIP